MPAVRRWRPLAVAAAAAGLVVAATLLAGPAMADDHGNGHGNGQGHGDTRSSAAQRPAAKPHGGSQHHRRTEHRGGSGSTASAASADALRHDIATAAARTDAKEGPGRSDRAQGRGRGHDAGAAQRHGRHAAGGTSRGAGRGQQPDVRTGPVVTTPVVRPASPAHRAIALPQRVAERTVLTHRPLVVAQPPALPGDGGARAAPPLQNVVEELGRVAQFSLFGGPVGWVMSGVLLVALLMVVTAFAVGRRRRSALG